MRTLLARIAVVGAAIAATVAVAPNVAQAAHTLPVITVDSASAYEGVLVCSDGFNDPPCGTVINNQLFIYVHISATQRTDVTVGWQLVDGTAHAGSDFTGPTTGTIVIARGTFANSMSIPLVFDGFNEPTEQFTMKLTSSSIPADISNVGTETILDGTEVPADCAASNPSSGVIALTCTARPATQQWRLTAICWPFGRPIMHFGNTVTGNGESSIDCGGAPIDTPQFRTV